MVFLLYKRRGVYRARRKRAIIRVSTDRCVFNLNSD